MRELVQKKFFLHPDLAEALYNTEDAILIEGNTWGDRCWGVYKGRGRNMLGRILMDVREELRHIIALEVVF